MEWKRTSIIVTMGNDMYPDNGIKRFTFNNIVADPTKEQVKQFVSGLLLLSDGDSYLGSEIVKHNIQSAE